MSKIHKITRHSGIVTLLSLSITGAACAGTPQATAPSPDAFKSLCDDVWGSAVLYKSSSNPYIQKIAFTGRAQFDYAWLNGDGVQSPGPAESDVKFHDLNTRRLRAGIKAQFLNDFTAHAEAEFQPEDAPLYQRITDAYIGWSPCDEFGIKVGKQGMGFTLDGKTSSKELLTIDRSNLSNNLWFTNEYIPGVTFSGTIGKWSYNTGVFSQGEEDKEFGDFDGGTSWLASVGYDLSSELGADEAVLALDYVYNEDTPTSPALFTNRTLEHVVSLNFLMEKDDFGFRGDVSTGSGYANQADVWGFTLMPYYNFTDKLQGVFRYTYLHSNDDNGVRFARYESNPMSGARGDEYQEAYLGLNYYLYGHKLKLQTGLQYVTMNDDANDGGEFDGLAWTTGLRISW